MKMLTGALGFALCICMVTVPGAEAAERSAAPLASKACSTTPLGAAQPYNGFFLNGVQQTGSGTAGRLAVGGDATLSDYSVGASLAATPPQNVLVVGGALAFSRGVINGNAVYGGTGTMTNTSMGYGVARQGELINFRDAAIELNRLAETLAHLARNGTTSAKYGVVTLRGTNRTRSVFHLSSSRLAAVHGVRITVPAGSTAVVVVSGASGSIHDLGFSLHGVTGAHVLLVFPTATALTIHGVGLQNSILAPHAAITFDNGAIDGSLIGSTLTGTGHLGSTPFTGCMPTA